MRFCALFLVIMGLATTALAVEYKGSEFRDPFARLKAARAAEAPVQKKFQATVEGILWRSQPPLAIVSGKVVRVGDTVNGAAVLAITREGVLVRWEDEERLLTMKEAKV